jgi:hypothetical protein
MDPIPHDLVLNEIIRRAPVKALLLVSRNVLEETVQRIRRIALATPCTEAGTPPQTRVCKVGAKDPVLLLKCLSTLPASAVPSPECGWIV